VVGWGVGGPSRGRPARFGTLRLGDLAIEGIAGDLYTGDKGAFSSPDLAGNLGGGVLSRYAVTFDYANRRIHLLADARAAHADDFDRSGLFLFADGEALRVADVAAGSAAAKAGIAAGERISHIDGKPAGSRSLDAWRRWLRESAVGTRVTLDLMRDDQSRTVTLALADRIPPRSP
jgi:predicted metalloprotease with PDZ domain